MLIAVLPKHVLIIDTLIVNYWWTKWLIASVYLHHGWLLTAFSYTLSRLRDLSQRSGNFLFNPGDIFLLSKFLLSLFFHKFLTLTFNSQIFFPESFNFLLDCLSILLPLLNNILFTSAEIMFQLGNKILMLIFESLKFGGEFLWVGVFYFLTEFLTLFFEILN